MRKACLYVHKPYQNNEIFNASSPLNRDDGFDFYISLKQKFQKKGIELVTQDQCSQEEAIFTIFNEMPSNLSSVHQPQKSIALLFESELIRPNDWKLENHKFFKYIFTWNDDFVDNKKYFKFNFTHAGSVKFRSFLEKKKFCTLVAGNKSVGHPLELYSKRVEAIRWFETNHPEKFEFYGMGWNMHTFSVPILRKILNRISPLKKMLAETWPSYRGQAASKLNLLRDFKFCICYENAQGIKGYITEKVLDAFAAGCIPVYWGAPNISDFIPSDCYILKTDFQTYDSLYKYLNEMGEDEYNRRLAAITNFLNGDKHEPFSPEYNARIIVERAMDV